MIKIAVTGASGRMGQTIIEAINQTNGVANTTGIFLAALSMVAKPTSSKPVVPMTIALFEDMQIAR
jgi:dihydrodipicolinate reductase